MKYVRRSIGSSLAPKLLGLYESELASLISELCEANFPTIIDVGAAEGYYAVGLARCSPKSQIIAFETEPQGRALLQKMAQLNGVEHRILVHGSCDRAALREVTEHHPWCLIVMDAEGAEADLLDPVAVPALTRCHILVELHEFIRRDIPDLIRRRFALTHTIREEWSADRALHELTFAVPLTRRLFPRWLGAQISDLRPEQMRWYYMEPAGAREERSDGVLTRLGEGCPLRDVRCADGFTS